MPERYLKMILNARVYDVARETPLEPAPLLSRRLGNRVFLKREDLQPVFSFKLRGAYNKIAHLDDAACAAGVIAASAGNHAQGVAMGARHRGIKATIVMPRTTPGIKVAAVRALGAKTVLHGDSYDEAYAHAMELVAEKGLTFIHPFDDPEVIAGQGTVGMELLRQYRDGDLHAIFVPVGGGGLAAGIAAYTKLLRPEVKIIAVEPDDAPSLKAAMDKGRRVALKEVGIFVDGAAVKQIGRETWRVLKGLVDEVVTVSTDEVCAAIKDVYDETRSIVEPAGALSAAGMKRYVAAHGIRDSGLIAINSGANINFDRLRHVAERAELGEQAEILLAVTIPEEPGSFLRFCRTIGNRGITEFNYRYADPKAAHVFAGIQITKGAEEHGRLVEALRQGGYAVLDLSDNELAKLHIRHMVGGRAAGIAHERLLRFEFPERPGALLRFLTTLGDRFNISCFHYRNHGAAYGRVLAGIEVPPAQNKAFREFLDATGYPWLEETDNPAYRLFIGA